MECSAWAGLYPILYKLVEARGFPENDMSLL